MEPLYENSTQQLHWTFSREILNDSRHVKHERALKELTSLLTSSLGNQSESNISVEEAVKILLTQEMEAELIKYYTRKIIDICRKMEYSWRVTFTAATFYQRFFLKNSVMNFDPAAFITTAIFVAGKAEENPLSLTSRGIDLPALCNTLNQHQPKNRIEIDTIVHSEMRFLEGLGFQLLVFHASELIPSLIMLLKKEYANLPSDFFDALQKIREDVEASIYCSDCIFLFSPSLIAFGIILYSIEKLRSMAAAVLKDVTEESVLKVFLKESFENEVNAALKYDVEKLKEDCSLVVAQIQQGEKPAVKAVCKEGLKKLKKLQKEIREIKNRKRKLVPVK